MHTKLQQRQENGLLRQLQPDLPLIDFCSNDYLGFARSGTLQQLIHEELQSHGLPFSGSTGSRLLTGNSNYAMALEEQLAGTYTSEASLLYNSGYDANIGLFSSLPQRGDTVLHDELIHASIIDGIRLSHAARQSFMHNDAEHLKSKLKQASGQCYVVVESIYSMDGDAAPLNDLVAVCEEYEAALIVDEAHAVGVFGQGIVQQLNLADRVLARIITFGKALGCHGAAILGSQLLRDYLVNFSRSFIYTTAAPLHQLAAIKMAHAYQAESTDAVSTLQRNIDYFNSLNKDEQLTFRLIPSNSAIQSLIIGDTIKAKHYAQRLQQAGFNVKAIRSPTVAAGSERLRIILHSFNTITEITQLYETLKQLIDEH